MGIWRYQCLPPGALCAANQNFNDCRDSHTIVSAPLPYRPSGQNKICPSETVHWFRTGSSFYFVRAIPHNGYCGSSAGRSLPSTAVPPPKKQLGQAIKTLARLPRQEYLPLGYAIFIAVNAQASSADSTDARPYSVPPYDDIVILSGSAFRSHWTAVSAKARTTGSASP